MAATTTRDRAPNFPLLSLSPKFAMNFKKMKPPVNAAKSDFLTKIRNSVLSKEKPLKLQYRQSKPPPPNLVVETLIPKQSALPPTPEKDDDIESPNLSSPPTPEKDDYTESPNFSSSPTIWEGSLSPVEEIFSTKPDDDNGLEDIKSPKNSQRISIIKHKMRTKPTWQKHLRARKTMSTISSLTPIIISNNENTNPFQQPLSPPSLTSASSPAVSSNGTVSGNFDSGFEELPIQVVLQPGISFPISEIKEPLEPEIVFPQAGSGRGRGPEAMRSC